MSLKFQYSVPFTMIDNAVLMDETLSVYDKAVYAVLCTYSSNIDKSCYPSYQTIAKKASCSRSKTIEAMAHLDKLGFIDSLLGYIFELEQNAKPETVRLPAAVDELEFLEDIEGRSFANVKNFGGYIKKMFVEFLRQREIELAAIWVNGSQRRFRYFFLQLLGELFKHQQIAAIDHLRSLMRDAGQNAANLRRIRLRGTYPATATKTPHAANLS